MTTMRELPRRSPICRCFEAISYLGPFETKVSYSMVSGAIFVRLGRGEQLYNLSLVSQGCTK